MNSSPVPSSSKASSSTRKAPVSDDRFAQTFSNDELENDQEASSDDENEEEENGEEGEDFSMTLDPLDTAPLSAKALAEFEAKQARAGIVYISRIPPAMRPSKVRHLMGGFGEVGRIYLQQEDPKRAYLRRKHTATKKAHYTEGWVEFVDKRVGRAVAEMLNGQPIGGKKGTRFRDDVWTLKYLPRFKWNMLTEQIAHERATHTARLRVELSQSRKEQKDYLKNVELARVLTKREERKKQANADSDAKGAAESKPKVTKVGSEPSSRAQKTDRPDKRKRTKRAREPSGAGESSMQDVLASVF